MLIKYSLALALLMTVFNFMIESNVVNIKSDESLPIESFKNVKIIKNRVSYYQHIYNLIFIIFMHI